jgi:hypothetical protein
VNELTKALFLAIVLGGLTVLQVFLSLRKNRWLGFILPALYLLFAFFASFGQMIYTGSILPIVITFIMMSIPAIINFAIYLACREKVKDKNQSEIEKMSIQDLN